MLHFTKRSLITEAELIKFSGSINFHSNFFDNFHVKNDPLYELVHDNVKFHWGKELKMLLQKLKHLSQKMVL